jgi:hypothetical protein
MKRCPSCQRTYTDESLMYCLEDGSQLYLERHDPADLPVTLIMPDPRQTAPQRQEAYVQPRPAPPPQLYTAPPPQWTPAIAPLGVQAVRSGPGKGLAITSLISGIVAFLLLGFCIIAGASGVNDTIIGGLFIFSAFLALVGAVLGIVAVAKTGGNTGSQNTRVMAIVALVLNGLYLLIAVLFLILGAIASAQ